MEGNVTQYQPQYNPKKPSNKLGWWFLVTIILIIGVGVTMYHVRDRVAQIINPEEECVSQDTAYAENPVPTIQEILDFRKDIREAERIDSVFLSIPDIALIDILMTHGTSLSNSDIVHIYESNNTYYESVLKGANVQKYYEDSIVKREYLQREAVDSLKRK